MRLLILAGAVLLTSASAAAPTNEPATPRDPEPIRSARVIDPNAGARSDCPPIGRRDAVKEGERPGLQRLGELPDADHYKAAYRRIDGCEVPIVADFGIGRR